MDEQSHHTKTLSPDPSRLPTSEAKETTTLQFHIPAPVLAKIVSYVADGGPAVLKNWILAGREGKAAVFSKETLSRVRLDRIPHFVRMSKPHSSYFKFFSRCLEHGNPYALFVESLRLAFCNGDLLGAIKISRNIKDVSPLATLLHIMLSSCSGVCDFEAFKQFKIEHPNFEEVEEMGATLISHINCVEPRRSDTYASTWFFGLYPECWQYHELFEDYNGERCRHCIYYYLSRDIRLLS